MVQVLEMVRSNNCDLSTAVSIYETKNALHFRILFACFTNCDIFNSCFRKIRDENRKIVVCNFYNSKKGM